MKTNTLIIRKISKNTWILWRRHNRGKAHAPAVTRPRTATECLMTLRAMFSSHSYKKNYLILDFDIDCIAMQQQYV